MSPIAEVSASRPERIKLVFISTGLQIGGAEKMLYRLASRIDSSRFSVSVISLSDKGAIGDQLEAANVRVHALGFRRGRLPWKGIRRLRDLLESLRPDIVQGWMYHADLAASVATRLMQSPPLVVWGIRQSLHELKQEPALTRAVIWACAKLSNQPAAILYNSRNSQCQHEAMGFSGVSASVIPNGFELPDHGKSKDACRRSLGLPSERVLIGLIARYHPTKDHAGFLSAAAIVARQCRDAHFVLAGSGVDHRNRALTRLLDTLGIADRVSMLGECEDTSALMSGLDVICSASRSEAFSNVIGEAMAAGVPSVVSDVGDSAEIIGRSGFVVPPSDPIALVAALKRMVHLGSAIRAELGALAQRRVRERYALKNTVQQYQMVYEEILSRVRYRRAI